MERKTVGANKDVASVALVAAAFLCCQSGLALPKYNRNNHVNDFQASAVAHDPVLAGSQIMVDDLSNTIYVSPSSKKAQTGLYQPLASSACEILADHYQLTYLMPQVSQADYVEVAKKGPFSSFFDAKLGNYVRHSFVLNQIVDKINEIDRIKKANKNVIIDYDIAKNGFEQAQNEFDLADAAYAELSKNILSLKELIIEVDDADERIRLETALKDARQTKVEDGPELKDRLREARREVHRLRPPYEKAKAVYEATIPNIEQLHADIKSLSAIFEAINELSIKNFETNERALKAFESSTVGLASASYSIWGDEVARLQNILASGKDHFHYFGYNVARLPIHNVRLKKPIISKTSGSLSGSFNGDISSKLETVGMSNDGLMVSDGSEISRYHVFTKNRQAVIPEVKTLSGDGAGTYQNLITRGALCTGHSEHRNSWPVNTIFKSGDLEIENNFQVFSYKPRSSSILAQSVALEYDFYARSDPTKVSCTLDVTKFNSFLANAGTSGFLFWRTSWSETERHRLDKSGLDCQVKLSPSGENPRHDEQSQYVESIRQAMMQEVAAEFILTYAKSWEISQRQPAIPDPGRASYRAGVALMTLCGANVYCAVGSIVLKAGNELFGSNAGKTKNQDYTSGIIHRSYEESSWTVSNGQAVIDLTVYL